MTAARLVNEHGPIEDFPDAILGEKRELALLFKDLATLRSRRRGRGRRRGASLARPGLAFAARSSASVTTAWSIARSRPRSEAHRREPGEAEHLDDALSALGRAPAGTYAG